MKDFFAPAIPAENVLSSCLRVHMVDSDGMEPDLRSRRDYVLLAPVQGFQGDGLYLVDVCGGPTLYRAENVLGGQIRIKLDNPFYKGSFTFSHDEFFEIALGIVVADIKVRDERFLRAEGLPC
ncbi:hypothetical protein [Rhizobium sp. YTU87027]|uniref:hypothetical protein n=1 Tax=Rhizobium sp. YTU87027 TaxID=3417741 RepID=UPI003D6885EC